MGEWCRYSSVLCQEASGCSGCEIYVQRNSGLAGADNRGSIPQKSIAKAGFFQDRLSPIINPHPAFANSSDLTVSSSDGAIPSRSIPVQVERSEQDAGTFYFNPHSSTINIKSPCNPYVEKAGLIFCTNHHHHTNAFSFTPYDYLLAADSAALDSGATFNINSAVTSLGLGDKNIKQAWVFAMFPHATPDYSDLLRRSALFPSHGSTEHDSPLIIQGVPPLNEGIQ